MHFVPIDSNGTQFNFSLRQLSSNDIPTLKKLCKEWFPIGYPDEWFSLITSSREDYYTISATINLEIIGVIVAMVESQYKCDFEDEDLLSSTFSRNTKVAYILVLGVVKEYRRLGIATLLIDSLIHRLTSDESCRHVKAIYLHVLTTNFSAIKLYEKKNFRLHRYLPAYYIIDNYPKDGYCYVLYINGGFSSWLQVFQPLCEFFSSLWFCRLTKRYFFSTIERFFALTSGKNKNRLTRPGKYLDF